MNNIARWIEEERIPIVRPRKPVPVFIRFGKWSRRSRSINFALGHSEVGVSVYPAKLVDGMVEPDYSEMDICILVEGRCAFPVTGIVVGRGSDGEPVLRNLRILTYPIRFMAMPEFVVAH